MDLINEIVELLKEKIVEEWTLAGHPLTGSFESSLEEEVIEEGNNLIINIFGNAYGIYLSEGVSADKVPYTRRRKGEGRGGTSKYITGLHNWVKGKLGISDDRLALGIAFGIANRHAEFGFPIHNGELGSKFLEEVNNKYQNELDVLINKLVEQQIEKILK